MDALRYLFLDSFPGLRCRVFEIMISFISTLRLVLKFSKLYLIGSKIILQEDRFQDVITPFFFFFLFQITKVFLDGHSNPDVQIIGLKMCPVLEHVKVPDHEGGPLLYYS